MRQLRAEARLTQEELAEAASLSPRSVSDLERGIGRTAVVDLAIAAHYGGQLDAIAHEVQQRAIADLRAKAGLQDVTVNVTVDDVIT